MRLVCLEAKTGRMISETILDEKDPDTGKNLQSRVRRQVMPVALPDVLTCDGKRVYMRSQQFDLQGKRLDLGPLDVTNQTGEAAHLFCQVGLLDDTYYHRAYWTYGRAMNGGYGGWPMAGRYAVAGRLLVFDDSTVYGYGRKPEYYVNTSVLEFHLFAAEKQVTPDAIDRVKQAAAALDSQSTQKNANVSDWALRQRFPVTSLTAASFRWSFDKTPLLVRAMALADRTLFLAGPPDLVNEKEAFKRPGDPVIQSRMRDQVQALAGQNGAILLALAHADGAKLAAYKLESPPVFDGLAAANGRLFVSTMDGKVLCLGPDGATALTRTDVELPATQFKTADPASLPQPNSAPAQNGRGKRKK
jgi:hypothetical protein